MSSCFGSRKKTGDREPLLPQYNVDTDLQNRLQEKFHTYQMVRALTKGAMPSTEQLIINLRALLASDILNPHDSSVTDSGRLLAKYTKQWLTHFIELLRNKNNEDQIQDFIWLLTQSKITLDTDDIKNRAASVKTKADAKAAYQSIRTVGSLLLTNSDFRLFLSDVQTVGRDIFKDSALAASKVAEDVAHKVEPKDGKNAITTTDAGPAPSQQDLIDNVEDVSKTLGQGVAEVSKETKQSVAEHMTDTEKDTLLSRLKAAVTKLRQRNDYTDSVGTIGLLIKRYALTYSRVAEETIQAAQDDVDTNPQLDEAMRNFWSMMTNFGDSKEWEALQAKWTKFAEHQNSNPDFEKTMNDVSNAIQKLLTDPDALNKADDMFANVRKEFKDMNKQSGIGDDVDALLQQIQTTYQSVLEDKDISQLINISMKIFHVLTPTNAPVNSELLTDAINVFAPLLISAIQHIPIPRLEISNPEIDLLLENLVIEPGQTVNNTSFLPFRLRAETYNSVELRKAHTRRTTTTAASLATLKIDGLSARADDVGFWMRFHSGIFGLADMGLASFALDERGMDVHLDVEIGQERLEKMLTLQAVRVKIHKLNYTLRRSKFSFLAWIMKPLLRPIIRKVMEKQIASAISDFFHAANRELVFGRERLRATRIADPQDLATFFKAVAARLTPAEDPDLYSRVGVDQPGEGVFKGVYAPGSVVKLWNEQAMRAGERVDDYERGAWRNDIFDVVTVRSSADPM